MIHYISADAVEDGLHDGENRHGNAQYREGGHTVVADDFVNDDLGKKRQRHPHALQKKGGHQNFAEQFFVMKNDRIEPIEIVFPPEIFKGEGRFEGQYFAAPNLQELGHWHGNGLVALGVKEKHGFVADGTQNNPCAVV